MNSTKMFLNLDLILGSGLLGVPVGALCIHTLVLSTGAVNSVVWLSWGVGIFGVHLSHILVLRCPVVLLCNPISVLFLSIGPLSSLEFSHI